MIEPTESDIGRAVIYVPEQWRWHFENDAPTTQQLGERGVITSFNKDWVFVSSGDRPTPKATPRKNLYWL